MSDILESIKEKLDIVDIVSKYVDLAKKGRNFVGICPFHQDSHPSMSVSPEKQMFKCFVCGIGGDLVKFVSDYEKITFSESLSKLAKKAGIEYKSEAKKEVQYLPKEKELITIMAEAMNFFQYSLMTDEGEIALEYAKKRGLDTEVREKFLIGFAPKKGLQAFLEKKGYDKSSLINAGLINQKGGDFFRNRLIFGIRNQHGDVVAFSARDIFGKSSTKYFNSPETNLFHKSSTLYNFFNAKDTIAKEKVVYINEGFMDVIAMNKVGFNNSIGIMGTSLTPKHIPFFTGKKVVLMLDSDRAGINATIKSIKLLLANKIKTSVVWNEVEKDPDDILNSVGIEGLKNTVNNQIEALEFIFRMHERQIKEKTPTTIQKFITSFAQYLLKESDLTKDFYVNKMAKYLEISKEIILRQIPIKGITSNSSKYQNNFKKYSKTNDFRKASFEKIEPKKHNEAKIDRYSYTLILSMIKKSFLREQYKETKVTLIDPIISAIANHLVSNEDGKVDQPPKELMPKIQEIINYGEFVESEKEFQELIERINKKAIVTTIDAFRVKLENTSDPEKRNEIIKKIVELESRK